jgi:hypothetical protein
MKKIYTILPLFVLLFSFRSLPIQEVQDKLGIKGPLEFNKKSFFLNQSLQPTKHEHIQVYLPSGQKLVDFKEKLSVQVYADRADLRKHFMATKEAIEKMCSEDPYYTQFVMEPKNKEERILFYTSSNSEKGKLLYTDFTIVRIANVSLEANKTALMQYVYTRRQYGEQEQSEPSMLAAENSGLVSQFSFLNLPSLQLK